MKKTWKIILSIGTVAPLLATPLIAASCEDTTLNEDATISLKTSAAGKTVDQITDLDIDIHTQPGTVGQVLKIVSRDTASKTVTFEIKLTRGSKTKTFTASVKATEASTGSSTGTTTGGGTGTTTPTPTPSTPEEIFLAYAAKIENYAFNVPEDAKADLKTAVTGGKDLWYDYKSYSIIATDKNAKPNWKADNKALLKLAKTPSTNNYQLANATAPTYKGTDKRGKEIDKISSKLDYRVDGNKLIISLKPVCFNVDGKYKIAISTNVHEIEVQLPEDAPASTTETPTPAPEPAPVTTESTTA
ncbi:Uncharacterised protein [Metamycoplasma cloacale]|nr:variable surface lipoprotein [Metamycoplasma cloacale]VEU79642.1 Uncharacterised protein [Metamycoplasma cloacale]